MISKKYEFKNFNTIETYSAVDLKLIQSDEFKVLLECNENIEEFIEIDLNEETLSIGLEGNHNYSDIKVEFTIYAPSIESIEASGASDIIINDYHVKNFEFDLSGASEVDGELYVSNQLIIESSGASDISLEGKVENVELDFSGASEFYGKKLIISKALEIESSGASSITVTANGTIDIDISGASSVVYYGSGELIKKDVSGVGSVKHK